MLLRRSGFYGVPGLRCCVKSRKNISAKSFLRRIDRDRNCGRIEAYMWLGLDTALYS
jgi:hypothetical protein